MTTASPIAFPTMEVPTADDTMEMVSPLPGHDDFEIDLDVMEDQTSNADKDMMGDDDYPDDAVDIDYQRDGANDADMMDDVAEPTMVDAEDQYPETNDNEMQYAAEEPFEAEMEDEYEEDNDVPMPKINEPGPITLQQENVPKAEGAVEPAESNDVAEEIKDTQQPSQESLQKSEDEDAAGSIEVPHEGVEQRDEPDSEKVAEESGPDQQQPENSEHEISATNEAELKESHPVQPDVDEVDQKDLEQAKEKDETAETQPPVDHPEPQLVAPPEEKVAHVPKDQEQRTNTDHRTGLHPVKIYYQDNEISLFPPREGDSSETFFLGDESLAYEDFGKLFESFREVLQEHIGENEILVVDIDCMNIQLTEDSLHISKVTLHQFVNLYLHLCDNESIGEPEALYLSLSTRLTIPAAISDLTAAANEGKGISEIFPWDDYEEVEQSKVPEVVQPNEPVQDVSESTRPQEQGSQEPQESHISREHEEHNEQETHVPTGSEALQAEEPEAIEKHGEAERENTHGKEEPEVPISAEEDAVRSEEGYHESQQEDSNEAEHVANDDQKDHALEDENLAFGDRDDDVPPTAERKDDEYEGEYEEGEYEYEFQEYNELELEEHAHQTNNQSFELEEQKTESTATITSLPAQDATENQQDTDSSVDAPQEEHNDHEDYHEIEGTGTGEEPNTETNPDEPEHAEYVEDLEYNDNAADYAYDDVEPEEDTEKAHEKPLSESHEPGLNGENEQDHVSQQDTTDEALQNDFEGVLHEQSESKVEDNAQGTAEPSGDLLGTAENLAGNPTEEAQDINGDNEDPGHGDSGEGWIETGDVSSSANAKDAVEDVTFGGDDDEYFNLDFDAEFGNPEESGISEAVAPEHVSTKRTREPEDETELTETSTPDVKRPRSS